MTISFNSRTDAGDPTFTRTDDDFTIVCAPGDKGRWLGDYLDPIKPGQELTFLAQARSSAPDDVCSTITLYWYANEPGYVVHSRIHIGEICGAMDDFKHFIHTLTVPEGVKSLRIDLRSWSGAGTATFRDVRILQAEPPPPPPPSDDKMISVNIDFDTVTWRITASKETVTAHHMPKDPTTTTNQSIEEER